MNRFFDRWEGVRDFRSCWDHTEAQRYAYIAGEGPCPICFTKWAKDCIRELEKKIEMLEEMKP